MDVSILTEKEKRVYDGIVGKGALNKMEIIDHVEGLWVIDEELKSMVRKEVLSIASLTPTDVMVFLGKFEAGNKEGAEAGIYALGERMGMTKRQVATVLFDEIKAQVAEVVMSKMLDDEVNKWRGTGSPAMLRRMISLKRDNPMDIMPKFNIPVIGIGAPSKYMMEDLGKRLNAEVVFPEHNDVGNAVGAILSKIARSLSATITPTPDYRYMASIPFVGATYYTHLDTAVAATRRWLENYLSKEIKDMGAKNIVTSSKIKTFMATEGGVGDWEEESIARTVNFVEVVSRAVGDPPEVE